MGEIRSTLDIIMEKTKNLQITEEEKAEIQRKETAAKVKGLLQRYLDGLLGMEDISREIGNMSKDARRWAKEALKNECMERIDFEKDNTQVLELLEEILGLDMRGVRELIEEFKNNSLKEAERIKGQMEKELRNKGIQGSAVVVNHRAAPEWHGFVEQERRRFRNRLRELE